MMVLQSLPILAQSYTRQLTQRFILWLFIISITMFFAALTSAYLVKQSELDSIQIALPAAFGLSTLIILLSSGSMQLAYFFACKNKISLVQGALAATFLLGVVFLMVQYAAWQALIGAHVYLVGHPSGSFIYVMSGAHGVHIISSLLFVATVLVQAFRYKVHSENMNSITMCLTYWHFLGGIWLYLHIFFLIMNN